MSPAGAPASMSRAAVAGSSIAIASAALLGSPLVSGCAPIISMHTIAASIMVAAIGGAASARYLDITSRYRTIVATRRQVETEWDVSGWRPLEVCRAAHTRAGPVAGCAGRGARHRHPPTR